MELRQIRYFVKVAEAGSISKAALALGTVQSGVSSQLSRLESELGATLLQRTRQGIELTSAGIAFLREAQLIIRHTNRSQLVVQRARLSGSVSIGFAGTTARTLAVPFLASMKKQFPEVRLHVIEGRSGHLESLLRSRNLDMAVVFNIFRNNAGLRVTPLLREKLLLLGTEEFVPAGGSIDLAALAEIPLVLPTAANGIRTLIDSAFAQQGMQPTIAAEIDSLSVLMQATASGFAGAVQPMAALAAAGDRWHLLRKANIEGFSVFHISSLCTIEDDELSPAELVAVTTLKNCVRTLVESRACNSGELVINSKSPLGQLLS